jgi:hypothetical protein
VWVGGGGGGWGGALRAHLKHHDFVLYLNKFEMRGHLWSYLISLAQEKGGGGGGEGNDLRAHLKHHV